MPASLLTLLLTVVLGALSPASSAAGAPTGCAAKRQDLLEKTERAREQGNRHQLAGLEKALAEVERDCDDESLLRERQEKAARARAEVGEREADLGEARAGGDSRKIAKREAKLAEAREELKRAESELTR